jgi:thiamine biosynthesis lipoprotein
MLTDLELAGYDRSIDVLRRLGAGDVTQVLAPPREGSFGEMRLDWAGSRVLLPAGLRIDLGGIAKGWIAEQAAEVLAPWSDVCLVDAGGDMILKGHPAGEGFWKVALEDPREAERDLVNLKLPPRAVATSSVTKRRWMQGGRERHHLIDPRTRQPVDGPWLSVTAIAATLSEAEAYAKAILIGGPRETEQLEVEAAGIEYIAVDKNGKLWGSKNSKEFIDV